MTSRPSPKRRRVFPSQQKTGSPRNARRGFSKGEGRRVFRGAGPKSKLLPKKPTEQSVVGFVGSSLLLGGCGDRIRTYDLRVMSPMSCHCSTPRDYYMYLDKKSKLFRIVNGLGSCPLEVNQRLDTLACMVSNFAKTSTYLYIPQFTYILLDNMYTLSQQKKCNISPSNSVIKIENQA